MISERPSLVKGLVMVALLNFPGQSPTSLTYLAQARQPCEAFFALITDLTHAASVLARHLIMFRGTEVTGVEDTGTPSGL